MKYGSGLFPPSVSAAVEYAQYLDRDDNQFEKLWMTDSHQLWTEVYTTLAVCAVETETIELAPGVTNPVTRHPSVTASAVATLNQISDGRASVGIGAGDSAVYSVGETPATVSRLREAVRAVESLLGGEEVTFHDTPFELDAHDGSAEVYVAAEGPRTLQMAGETADSVLFGGGTEPEIVERLGLANIAEGAARAGRSLDDIHVAVLAPACIAETKAEGFDRLKHLLEPIAYHNFSFSIEEAPDDIADDLERLVEAHEMREHGQTEAERPEKVSQEALAYIGDRFAITGPANHCRDRLRALKNLGVDEVLLGLPHENLQSQAAQFDETILQPLA